MPQARVSVEDVELLIGLTAAVEGLIRVGRLESDEVTGIARHVDEPGLTLEETLAGLNLRLRESLAPDAARSAN